MTIKPIETVYKGYRFRSRLEARWAVFFDTLGVKYEYEPEGFYLGNGLCYLPDFKVKCYGTRGNITDTPFDLWIEVKGVMNEKDALKIRKFSGYDSSSFYDEYIKILERRKDEKGLRLSDEERHSLDKYCTSRNKVLVVHRILDKGLSSDNGNADCYSDIGCGIQPFNYEFIDGDSFGAYPAADKYGRFYLWGDDSNYINSCDVSRVERAYEKARQARFEYGDVI